MKRLLYLLLIGFAFVFTACEKEEDKYIDDKEVITNPSLGRIDFYNYLDGSLNYASIKTDDNTYRIDFYNYSDGSLNYASIKTDDNTYRIDFYNYSDGSLNYASIK